MSKKTLRPCDCIDEARAEKLDHRGISHNDQGIKVEYGRVVLEMGPTTTKISLEEFQSMCEFVLETNEKEGEEVDGDVVIDIRYGTINVPLKRFIQFAKWFMEEQEVTK